MRPLVRKARQHVGRLAEEFAAANLRLGVADALLIAALQAQCKGIQDRGVVGQLLLLGGRQMLARPYQDVGIELRGLVVHLQQFHKRHGLLLALQIREPVVNRRFVLGGQRVHVVEGRALEAAATGALDIATLDSMCKCACRE